MDKVDCFGVGVTAKGVKDLVRRRCFSPIGFDLDRIQAEGLRHFYPSLAELPAVDGNDGVPGREQVHERRFDSAGAGAGEREDRLFGLEQVPEVQVNAGEDLGEFRMAVMNDRLRHFQHDSLRNRGRSRSKQSIFQVLSFVVNCDSDAFR